MSDSQEKNSFLFELIKNHEWDKIKKALSDKEHIDVNIRDKGGNYLITYAVLLNKKDIVSMLINKGSRLDVVVEGKQSLLHIAIRYRYMDLIKLLLYFNNISVGVPLIDIQDKNKQTPLFFAIKRKDKEITDLLLKAGSNVNSRDVNNHTALHLAIYTRDLDLINNILEYPININSRTKSGETALHIACNLQLYEIVESLLKHGADINIGDENEFTALHYVITNNSTELAKLLIKHKANINQQDYFGNNSLHYSIIEDAIEIFDMISNEDNIYYNLINAEGNIPLHLALMSDSSQKNKYIETLLLKSNLNIINNDRQTCLSLIIENGYFNKYIEILSKKKLDIFIKVNKNKRIIDLVDKTMAKKLIDTATEGYLYSLKTEKKCWKHKWQSICSITKSNTLDKKEKDILSKITTMNTDDRNKYCYQTIKELLEKKFKHDDSDIKSYPLDCFNNIKITEGADLNICIFTGITFDILVSMLYLQKIHSNVCIPLSSDPINNPTLKSHYVSQGYNINSRTEFMNFEVVWSAKKLFYPVDFRNTLKKCLRKDKRFVIIPFGIEGQLESHANILIYDSKQKIIERFEPNGSTSPADFDYNSKLLDSILTRKFEDLFPDAKYLSPSDYLPKIGFQIYDINDSVNSKLGDPDGFCAAWTVWYANMRMTYPDLHPRKLVHKLIETAKRENISFKNMVRNFTKPIIDFRTEIFNKAKIDINQWINANYSTKQEEILKKEITDLIKQN